MHVLSKSSHHIKAVLFDLDGTLIDTEPQASQVLTQTFQEWNVSLTSKDAHFITGRTWKVAFEYLFKTYAPPLPHDEAADLIMKRYQNAIQTHLVVVPGAIEAVQALAKEFPLALVSGSRREEIEIALTRLKLKSHFQFFYGAEDYPMSKPDPSGYLKALQTLGGLKGADALVFEDSTAGITAARAAGLWTIAVTSTNHFDQNHTNAHHHVHDLSGITPTWIKNLTFLR